MCHAMCFIYSLPLEFVIRAHFDSINKFGWILTKCVSKVQEYNDEMGECVRCHVIQNLADCHEGVMAWMLLKPGDGATLTEWSVQLQRKSLHEISSMLNRSEYILKMALYFQSVAHELNNKLLILKPGLGNIIITSQQLSSTQSCNHHQLILKIITHTNLIHHTELAWGTVLLNVYS